MPDILPPLPDFGSQTQWINDLVMGFANFVNNIPTGINMYLLVCILVMAIFLIIFFWEWIKHR